MNSKTLRAIRRGLVDNKYSKLTLVQENITGKQLRQLLEALKQNTSLRELDLSSNGLGDEAILECVQVLSTTRHSLQQLNLSSNRLSLAGLEKLSIAIEPNIHLHTLRLAHNPYWRDSHQAITAMLEAHLTRNRNAPTSTSTQQEVKTTEIKEEKKQEGQSTLSEAGSKILSPLEAKNDEPTNTTTAWSLEGLEERIGYEFTGNLDLLRQALIRKSAVNEKMPLCPSDNKRLEFLGDSILRTVVDDILLELYPNEDTDSLSKRRDEWVSKKGFLYEAANKMNLSAYARMGKNEHNDCKGAGKYEILSSLMEAVIGAVFIDCNKDYSKIKQLIATHSFADQPLYKDRQLFNAVKNNDLNAVNHWLKRGANPRVMYYDCRIPAPWPRPFILINDTKPLSYVDFLRTTNEANALTLAIRNWSLTKDTPAIVEALLKSGACLNGDEKATTSLTPLLYETIAPGRSRRADEPEGVFPQLTRLLCQYGANPNDRGHKCREDKYTPLELAIFNGDPETVQILLACDANANMKDNSKGRTPLHWAAVYAEYYYRKFLEAKKDTTSFFKPDISYREPYREIMATLIQHGAKLTVVDKDGKLPVNLIQDPSLKTLLKPPAPTSTQLYSVKPPRI